MLDNVCTAVAQNKMSELTLWFFWGPKQQMQKYAGCVTNAEIQLHQMTPRSSREQKSILPRSLGKRKLISNHLQPFTIIVVFWYTAWFVRKIYHYYSFSCRTYCIIWKEGFLFDLASLTLSGEPYNYAEPKRTKVSNKITTTPLIANHVSEYFRSTRGHDWKIEVLKMPLHCPENWKAEMSHKSPTSRPEIGLQTVSLHSNRIIKP